MRKKIKGVMAGLLLVLSLCLIVTGGMAATHALLERHAKRQYREDGVSEDNVWDSSEDSVESYLSAGGRLELLAEFALDISEEGQGGSLERAPRGGELTAEEAAEHASDFLYMYNQVLAGYDYPSQLGLTEPEMKFRADPDREELALWSAYYAYDGAWLLLFLDARTGMPVRMVGYGSVNNFHEENQAVCFLGRNVRKSDPFVSVAALEYLEPFLDQVFVRTPVSEGFENDEAYYFPSMQWITAEGEYALTIVGGESRRFDLISDTLAHVRFDMVVSPVSYMKECMERYAERYTELRYFNGGREEAEYHDVS